MNVQYYCGKKHFKFGSYFLVFFLGYLIITFLTEVIFFLQLQLDQQATIPLANWNWTSYDDSQSHLLQGVRVSTEFINSLMWFASISNLTTYEGSARVMDTRLEGAIKEFRVLE